MEFATYVAYVFASFIVMAAPGPTVILIVSHAIAWGVPRTLYTILGTALSCSLLFTAFALGAAVVMETLAPVFELLRLAGAAYLIWLGVEQWRTQSDGVLPGRSVGSRSAWSLIFQGFVVNGTNPKSLAFFVVFLPPFLNPAAPSPPQLMVMGSTFIAILVAVTLLYALAAVHAQRIIGGGDHAVIANRASGTLLVGTGLALAASRSN